jgi:hypothetical protein
MEISGPFLNHAKKRAGNPSCSYLSYFTPKLKADENEAKGRNGHPQPCG